MPKLASLLATAFLLCGLPAPALAVDLSVSTTPVTDGPVSVVAYDSSGRAYVGGSFDSVGPRLGSGLRITTSSTVPGSLPDINGTVLAVAPDGVGGQFIGGSFTAVGGVPRNRLAHIFADGALDANWNPGANNVVRALALSPAGDALYVGGDFNGAGAIGGVSRSRLAKLSAATGTVDPDWDPAAFGSVRALVAAGSAVFVGGSFGSVDSSAPRLAKLKAGGGGDVDPAWAVAGVTGSSVNALAVSGSDLYVGGQFGSVGAATRHNLARLATGGAGDLDPTWDPDADAAVLALQVSGTDLFAGGQFFSIGGQLRPGVAKLATTGAGGADATWNPAPSGAVNALALAGGELVVGGDFFLAAGPDDIAYLAKVPTTGTGAPTAWNPRVNGPVRALGAAGSNIFAGGDFSSAGPQNESRGSLFRLNPNGSLDKSWDPQVRGATFAISLQGTELIAGGTFVRVHGQSHHALAKFSTANSGERDATWATEVNGQVKALARSGDDLFVGGDFFGPNSVGNQNRGRIAKVSAVGVGPVDPTWNPNVPFGEVDALAVSGGDLFAGGSFGEIGGQPRSRLGKVSTTGTGAADATWAPEPSNTVFSLLLSGSSLYAGGSFGTIGGAGPPRAARVATGGAGAADTTFDPVPNGEVHALALTGGNLYVGGIFGTIDGAPRARLARVSPTTGAVDGAFEPAPSTSGGSVDAIAATGTRVLVGGSFNSIGPLSTSHLAIFDLTAPTLSLTSPFDGARYKQGQPVDAAYTCDDPDGPADSLSCTGTVPSGAPIDTATPGAKKFTATSTDAGGRSASSTVGYTVDGSAPGVSIAVPSDGAVFVAGTQVPVTFSCSDEDGPTDVASCAGSAPAGSPLDVSKDGTFTFTVTSADLVGNATTRSVTYRVTGNPKPPGPPVLSSLKIKPAKFKAKKGTRVSFRLSKAGTVTFTVKGKRKGSFTRKAKRGANTFKFRGKVKRKTLKPGKYRLSARARDAGGLRSKTLTKPFRILKP